ncbi:Uncharacterized protein APZ42_021425 [Daphnia magna]|uniref:Uncharacterized protein n=1 Tax=Daphnia magna TaxID=35525 RepID=A0A164WPD4_9CRUS|nr:Uncharacterized protein APZ42_021425 [Daphnia magna]
MQPNGIRTFCNVRFVMPPTVQQHANNMQREHGYIYHKQKCLTTSKQKTVKTIV